MQQVVYRTRVRRKRGKWHVSVPALPGDAPVVVTTQLGNAAPLLISELAEYLGVSVAVVEVEIEQPARPTRTRTRDRLSASLVQLLGGGTVAGGVYLTAGMGYTLIAAGLAAAVLGALRESGRI